MNPMAKEMWLEKLRGDFDKCEGQLHQSMACFSACGLLCLSYSDRRGGFFVESGGFHDALGYCRRAGVPADVLQWAGIEDKGHGVKFGIAGTDTVVALNDGIGHKEPHTLEACATAIEKYL